MEEASRSNSLIHTIVFTETSSHHQASRVGKEAYEHTKLQLYEFRGNNTETSQAHSQNTKLSSSPIKILYSTQQFPFSQGGNLFIVEFEAQFMPN
jgi:hypothetical protein